MCFFPFSSCTCVPSSTIFLSFSALKSPWMSSMAFWMFWLNRHESCRSQRRGTMRVRQRQKQKRVLSFERLPILYTDVSITSSALMLCSYGVSARKLAGDMECDEVFPNDDIRHAITVISHLGVHKRRFYFSVAKPSAQDVRVKQYECVTGAHL